MQLAQLFFLTIDRVPVLDLVPVPQCSRTIDIYKLGVVQAGRVLYRGAVEYIGHKNRLFSTTHLYHDGYRGAVPIYRRQK